MRQSRSYRIEQLESRQLLTSTPWNDGSGLTVSFAPDGVDIAGLPNQLHQKMDTEFAQEDWKREVLKAFQKWASEANTNVGVVDELDALPFGVEGAQSHDYRFGDVRIGARPLSPNIKALSIPNDSPLAGTWSGDVIFNSNASFDSLRDLLSVSLHEAGHVFGLKNSDATDSAMNSMAPQLVTSPSVDDIRSLQSLFQSRKPDFDDYHLPNNSIRQATFIDAFSYFDDGFGTYPLTLFGDIGKSDIDYYEVQIPDSQYGSVEIILQTEGISLLAPQLTILDRNGNELSTTTNVTPGGDVEISIDSNDVLDTLFLKIEAGNDADFRVGSYVATVIFDEYNHTISYIMALQ